MNIFSKDLDHKENAQGMVEFALIIPVLLVLVFGVMELGRLFFIYAATLTASREAARYGSAVGGTSTGVPRYLDCAGMRQAARRLGSLAGIQDSDISITYDDGDPTHVLGNCPVGGVGSTWGGLGTRVYVSVSTNYKPIVPLVPLKPFAISSETARTIIKDVIVGTALAPSASLPTVNFETTYIPVPEDVGTVQVNFTLSERVGRDVFVNFTVNGVTAQEGNDFTYAPHNQVVIPAGSWQASIVFNINDDNLNEADETIEIHMISAASAVPGTPDTAVIKIMDDDNMPKVFFDGAPFESVDESVGNYLINAQLDFPSGQEVRVPIGINSGGSDTATRVADYKLLNDPDGYHSICTLNVINENLVELVFVSGQSCSLVVDIVDDNMDENDETFSLQMGSPINAELGDPIAKTVQIEDNDDQPLVGFTTDKQFGTEGQQISLELHLSAASSFDVKVNFTDNNGGTATRGSDYTIVTPSPVVIPAGEVKGYVLINPIADGDFSEGDETVIVSIVSAENATPSTYQRHTVTITNRTVSFKTGGQLVNENAGTATAIIQLNAAVNVDTLVSYTLGGTATEGADYTIDPASVSPVRIPAGETSAPVLIHINDDTIDEWNETLSLTLLAPENCVLISPNAHTITFEDNDKEPTVTFQVASQDIDEGAGTGTITIALSGASGKDVTVSFNVSGGTATVGVDYAVITPTLQTVVIPPGQTSLDIQLAINDDSYNESNETVLATLTGAENAVLGAPVEHTTTIVDNDATPSVYFTQPDQIASESAGDISIGVRLSAPSGLTVSVPFLLEGTATRDVDYTLNSPANLQIVFQPGQTTASILIHIINDSSPEFEEQIDVTLHDPVNAQLSPSLDTVHEVRITDDDDSQCRSLYSVGKVSVNNGQKEISTSLTSGSTDTVHISGFNLRWSDSSVCLTGVIFGNHRIWPSSSQTFCGGSAWINSNWVSAPGADPDVYRAIPNGETQLIFEFSGSAKLDSLDMLYILLDNSCNISK